MAKKSNKKASDGPEARWQKVDDFADPQYQKIISFVTDTKESVSDLNGEPAFTPEKIREIFISAETTRPISEVREAGFVLACFRLDMCCAAVAQNIILLLTIRDNSRIKFRKWKEGHIERQGKDKSKAFKYYPDNADRAMAAAFDEGVRRLSRRAQKVINVLTKSPPMLKLLGSWRTAPERLDQYLIALHEQGGNSKELKYCRNLKSRLLTAASLGNCIIATGQRPPAPERVNAEQHHKFCEFVESRDCDFGTDDLLEGNNDLELRKAAYRWVTGGRKAGWLIKLGKDRYVKAW